MERLAAFVTSHFGAISLFVLGAILGLYLAAFVWFELEPTPWHFVFLITAFVVGIEVILRATLLLAFGTHYRYAIFVRTLVDHETYGFAFAPNQDVRDIRYRVFDKYMFAPGSGPPLKLQKNIGSRIDFQTNSLGFRGSPFEPKNTSSRLRIFCSGGSTTACGRVSEDEAWPSQLQEEFKNRGCEVEVINAGVFGWTSWQEFLRFRDEIIRYDADVVLLHQGWNDEFCFSSQSLGRTWRPRVVRNRVEANDLHLPPNRLLSQRASIALFLLIRAFRRRFLTVPRLRADNPRRWACQKNSEYLLAWFENLLSFARLADKGGILLYTIDYPSLATFEWSSEDRESIIHEIESKRAGRLTPDLLLYQAMSKERITRLLRHVSGIIPSMDARSEFGSFGAEDRAKLFYDEMHLMPEGNALFAKSVCDRLLSEDDFCRRYQSRDSTDQRSNVAIDENGIAKARFAIARGEPDLIALVDRKIKLLARGRSMNIVPDDVPSDRYTTF